MEVYPNHEMLSGEALEVSPWPDFYTGKQWRYLQTTKSAKVNAWRYVHLLK
ncbi:hypothetical protein ACUNWD_07810 [Sunxiuqinia sp. A32]|uniref:hypothetical protein n=1 Tax=Sunxiuqinia sp. A32 TaxID=3461496 RepID=UPI004045BE6D